MIALDGSCFRSPAIPNNEDAHKLVEPKALKSRFLILIIFMFLSTMNNLTQFSFSPITDLTKVHSLAFDLSFLFLSIRRNSSKKKYYQIDDLQLNMLALVFMISGFTTRFIAMWLIDNKGLGVGVLLQFSIHLNIEEKPASDHCSCGIELCRRLATLFSWWRKAWLFLSRDWTNYLCHFAIIYRYCRSLETTIAIFQY
jgi:hypothetical protein